LYEIALQWAFLTFGSLSACVCSSAVFPSLSASGGGLFSVTTSAFGGPLSELDGCKQEEERESVVTSILFIR